MPVAHTADVLQPESQKHDGEDSQEANKLN